LAKLQTNSLKQLNYLCEKNLKYGQASTEICALPEIQINYVLWTDYYVQITEKLKVVQNRASQRLTGSRGLMGP